MAKFCFGLLCGVLSTRLQPRRKRAKFELAIYGLDLSSPHHWLPSSQNLANVRFECPNHLKVLVQ